MAIEIEGIWKDGKIVPLERIELEENTILKISFTPKEKKRKSIKDFAGIWKNDLETYKAFKSAYKARRKFTLRK